MPVPIRLSTGESFFLPSQQAMLQELAQIDRVIGPGPSFVLVPTSDAQACFFAFLAIMGNGVLNAIKTYLLTLIAQLDILLIALRIQVAQLEILRGSVLGAEQAAVAAARNAIRAPVDNIISQVNSEIAKQTSQGQGFLQGATLSDLRKCPPVDALFTTLLTAVAQLNQVLNELDFTVTQETSFLETLKVAIDWAEGKKRYLQWYISSIDFVVGSR